jgi:pimeloyl-ACP methyl ester carboxylesterase
MARRLALLPVGRLEALMVGVRVTIASAICRARTATTPVDRSRTPADSTAGMWHQRVPLVAAARVWLDGPLAPPQRVRSPLRELFLDMNGRALAATSCGTAAPFESAWDSLPSLRLPVSIVVGDLDMPGLVAAAKATAERIPNAEFQILSDTAHLPMLEQPSVIAQEVLDLAARA